jgi:hypothetical protein
MFSMEVHSLLQILAIYSLRKIPENPLNNRLDGTELACRFLVNEKPLSASGN